MVSNVCSACSSCMAAQYPLCFVTQRIAWRSNYSLVFGGWWLCDFTAMARAVELINPDKEILSVRIFDGNGHEIFSKYQQGKPESLVLVRAAVEDGTKMVGAVELGMGQASTSETVTHAVFVDLIIGA